MKYNTSTLGRRAAAAAGVLALAVLGLAPMAQAENANHGDINTEALGSLTIHKHLNGDGNPIGAPDGTASNDDGKGAPVSGVQFTAYEINGIDLKTSEGWAKVNALTNTGAIPDNACANPGQPTLPNYTFRSSRVSGDTDRDGQAKIESLPVKAYLVCETKTPVNIVQKAKPFVVTVPHPNTAAGADGQWIYDVHVYPKNTLSGVDKQVTDKPAPGSGRDITYTITTSIPKVDYPGGARIKRYEVVDRLDKRINKDALTPVVKIVGQNEVTLANGTDYTLITAEGKDHNWATIQLTEEGRRKASEARYNGNGDTKIEVTLTAKFDAAVNLEGDLSNTAGLIPNDSPNFTWDPNRPGTKIPGIPTTPALSKYGKVVVTKTGTDDLADKTKYNGAQFQVYECTKTASGATLRDSDPSTPTVDPLTVGGETTFTTAGQGTVEINYLRANDYVNGAKKDQLTDEDHYCLVETKAPEGYTLQADPIPFRVMAEKATAKAATAVTVTDVPKNAGFRLPLTGANGVIFLTVAGALLVIGGAVSAYANKRRYAARH